MKSLSLIKICKACGLPYIGLKCNNMLFDANRKLIGICPGKESK